MRMESKRLWDVIGEVGGQLRSEPMEYLGLSLDRLSAPAQLSVIVDTACFHVVDLNSKIDDDENVQLYVSECKRRASHCAAVLERLEKFRVHSENILKIAEPSLDDEIADSSLSLIECEQALEIVEPALKRLETLVEQQLETLRQLWHDRIRLRQRQAMLEFAWRVREPDDKWIEMEIPDELERNRRERNIEHIYGMTRPSQQPLMEKMVFRLSRGNAHISLDASSMHLNKRDAEEVGSAVWDAMHQLVQHVGYSVNHPVQDEHIAFCVTVLGKTMMNKTLTTLRLLDIALLPLIDPDENLDQEIQALQIELRQQWQVIHATSQRVLELVQREATPRLLTIWRKSLQRTFVVHQALSQGRPWGSRQLRLCGWCPRRMLPRLQQALTSNPSNAVVMQRLSPPLHSIVPTSFPVHPLVAPFQRMVDTYGVPRYREMNPAVFSCVTFPFLFAMMFGDVGHGMVLLVSSLYLMFVKRSKEQVYREAAVMLLLLGLSAMYCGLLYDDFLGWSTGWTSGSSFGVDPHWHDSTNKLAFLNSLKMKLSIIVGVTHMSFGLLLHAMNLLFEQDIVGLIVDFTPRLLLMLCTFGYMALLILLKWFQDWTVRPPPSLIDMMIGMFLGREPDVYVEWLYPFQPYVEPLLVSTACLSVPVMMFGRLIWHHREKFLHRFHRLTGRSTTQRHSYEQLQLPVDQLDYDSDLEEGASSETMIPSENEHHHEGPDIIHELIHTIEFVLGSVSNTASYLRLWALSLAHQQLAEVFLVNLLQPALASDSLIAFTIGSFCWLAATIGILCCMDCLECCLHALRLHWVEFQSKFYHADGLAFQPLKIDEI